MIDAQLSTGLPGLDRVLKGLIPGDNIVWQVASAGDYAPFIRPFCEFARARGKRLVYFRFGDHEPLVPDDAGAEVCHLQFDGGFEQFIGEVHRAIGRAGRGAFLVFDCLSSLAVAWCSDRMLGNFFMLTCPYIFDLESIAFFGLLRGTHSFHATTPIAETTQIFIEVYRHRDGLYIHPIKVQHRYSPTMYMLHAWKGEAFPPVTESSTIAEILTSLPWSGLDSVRSRLGVWNRRFYEAAEYAGGTGILPVRREGGTGILPVPREGGTGILPVSDEHGQDARATQTDDDGQDARATQLLHDLLRMAVSRDERVLRLAEKYLTLDDVLAVWRRMIGTGLIGGKSVGMLLARAILKRADPRWNDLLEAHDSFFIGSDVFYTFLVQNGCWWLRQKQTNPDTFLEGVEEARRRILMGVFPDYIRKEFADMLDYFGQSPIIVRSSSLLEDAFGNAFAGKYESVFCANQGPHQKRLEDFMSAVRTIYASTMSEKALRYRAQRGILDRDEQMSLLVQRVSGFRYQTLFYPQIAGVGLSFNPYVWNEYIDPAAGLLRLVFGLGTRAVDRSDDDYTRVVSLNAPERRPEADADEIRQYSQHKVDLIDLEANQLVSSSFQHVAHQSPELPIDMFASRDRALANLTEERGLRNVFPWVLDFDRLLTETPFVADMRQMLGTLQAAYECPVDMEFTANFFAPDRYKINLVQCRPLQVASSGVATAVPADLQADDVILEAHGAVIGQSRVCPIERLVYVVPSVYGQLPIGDRYAIARLIGRVMHLPEPQRRKHVMLIGPGRWGTTTPSLGVPVAFAEIDTASVLCEIVAMRDDLVPDVSLGTHFFNELVELDLLYLALFPNRKKNAWNREFLEHSPNRLAELLPEEASWANVVRVIDVDHAAGDGVVRLNANAVSQTVVCYRERG